MNELIIRKKNLRIWCHLVVFYTVSWGLLVWLGVFDFLSLLNVYSDNLIVAFLLVDLPLRSVPEVLYGLACTFSLLVLPILNGILRD